MPYNVSLPQKSIEVTTPSRLASGTGQIIWQEGFEANLNRFDAGGSVVTVAYKVRQGVYSFKITSAAGEPYKTATGTSTISIYPEMFNAKIGIEFFVRFEAVTTAAAGAASFENYYEIGNGVTKYTPAFQVVFGAAGANCSLQYKDSAGNWQDIITGLSFAAGYFYRFKLILNLKTGYYDKLIWGATEYDLSAYAIRTAAYVHPISLLGYALTGIDATQKSVWLDDITVTVNEP